MTEQEPAWLYQLLPAANVVASLSPTMLGRLIALIDCAPFIPTNTLDLDFYGGSFRGHATLALSLIHI